MRAVARIKFAFFLLVIAFAVPAFGSATNIYITQTGSPTGNCTTNVQIPSFFNNSANWGTGPNQIGPGTTVLLCGTFAGTAGQTGFTFQGSGTAGSPVTLLFDTGAQMSAPYWGSSSSGAISCSNHSNLLIDGGSNGLIQNTANGTSLANHQASHAIYTTSCTNTEIRNLTVSKIYVNQGSSSGATDAAGNNSECFYLAGNSTGDSAHNNTLSQCRTGVEFDYDSGHDASNVSIYGNTISDMDWGVSFGACNASSTATGVKIYNNDISNWTNWQFPTGTYHTDGLILYNDADGGHTCAGTAQVSSYQIYNNYFHGSLGAGSPTGMITCGETTQCTVFNNLIVDTGANACYGYMWFYVLGGPNAIFNNTIVGGSNKQNVAFNIEDGFGSSTYSLNTFKNNIVINVAYGIVDYNTGGIVGDVSASNNNVWQTTSGSAPQMSYNFGGSSTFVSYSSWQKDGFDLNSSTATPNLNGSYIPQPTSSAIGLGTSLTSLSITALNTSAPATFGVGGSCGSTGCITRSPSPDAGAYQYSSSNGAGSPTLHAIAH